MGGAAAFNSITQQRPIIARYTWPVGAALAKPRDCSDDRISNGRRNETRSLSLMSAEWVKSGTAKQRPPECGPRPGRLIDSSAFDLPGADYAVPDDQTRCQDHGNQSIRRTFRT